MEIKFIRVNDAYYATNMFRKFRVGCSPEGKYQIYVLLENEAEEKTLDQFFDNQDSAKLYMELMFKDFIMASPPIITKSTDFLYFKPSRCC